MKKGLTFQKDNNMQNRKLIQQYNLFMKAKHPNNLSNQAKNIQEFLPGPVKIKDGLFMGDEIAAKDIEFIISNKVTHIINTVSKKIPNLWERFGIHYLSVNWTEKQQNIFDKKNNAINAIFNFIEEAMEQGQSCLIHSINGKSRACAVTIAYLMKKYQWSLNKCFEYISSKKENLQIRNGYLAQFQELDKRMSQMYNLSKNWNEIQTDQELIIKNTFINSQVVPHEVNSGQKSSKNHISWVQKPTIHKLNHTKTQKEISIKKIPEESLKPILKGCEKETKRSEKQFSPRDEIPSKKENNYINNINGNIVHVTVNNFIHNKKNQGDKTPTRPFSSDQKEREKQKKSKKFLNYDQNYVSSFKSPYESKLGNKIGSNSKLPRKREEKEGKNNIYERPQSAKHKSNVSNRLKQDLMINQIGKKRYPSSNPRQQFFKRK